MPWRQVQLADPFSPECLRALLAEGGRGTLSTYCHDTIMTWATDYAEHLKPVRHYPDHERIWLLLDDMITRWELHIAGSYTLRDMKRFSRTDMILPRQYFTAWLTYLDTDA